MILTINEHDTGRDDFTIYIPDIRSFENTHMLFEFVCDKVLLATGTNLKEYQRNPTYAHIDKIKTFSIINTNNNEMILTYYTSLQYFITHHEHNNDNCEYILATI